MQGMTVNLRANNLCFNTASGMDCMQSYGTIWLQF